MTTVYGLPNTKATGDKLFAATEVNPISDAIELIGVRLAELFGEGCFAATDFNGTIVPGALSISVSAGTSIVGGTGTRKLVNKAGATLVTGLTAGVTNYVYLQRAGTFTSNTTGTAPANSHKVLSCVCNATEVTSINNLPAGRFNLPAPWRQVTLAAHGFSTPAADTNYYLEADFSGTGSFGSLCYLVTAVADGANIHVQEDLSQKAAGKIGLLVYVEAGAPSGSYGYPLDVEITVTLLGTGWTGASNTAVAATWTEPAAI